MMPQWRVLDPRPVAAMAALSVAAAGCAGASSSSAGWSSPQDLPPPACEGAPAIARPTPQRVQVVSGMFHTCLRRAGGEVYCLGLNHYRQLGDGTWEPRNLPARVRGVDDAVDIAATEYGACAARRSGRVACWGEHWGPDPADAKGVEGAVDVSVYVSAACAVTRDGRVVCWGAPNHGYGERVAIDPAEIPGITDAVRVEVGEAGLCVLHACGRISCASSVWEGGGPAPRFARLERIPDLEGARDLAMASYVGAIHNRRACALLDTGEITCFVPDSRPGYVRARPPEQLRDRRGFVALGGGNGICAADDRGDIACFGPTLIRRHDPSEPEVPDVVSRPGALSLAHGGAFRCAALASGGLSCWGRELGGRPDQLFVPMPLGRTRTRPFADLDARVHQVAASRTYTCAVRDAGEVVCWGPAQLVTAAGDHGGAGHIYLRGDRVPGWRGMAKVAPGDGFACARTVAGEVFCFGRDDRGQLGDGPHREDRQLPTPVEGLTDAVALSAGPAYACAVRRESGLVVCWGEHPASGATGPMPAPIAGVRDAVGVATGARLACAWIRDGRVLCWGSERGAAPAEIPAARGAVEVVAGARHACARLADGRVTCWGAASSAASAADLPAPAVDLAAGGPETCAVLRDGRVTCWGSRIEIGAPWTAVTDAAQVAVSGEHTCVLRTYGEVVCWGDGDHGKLGEGPSEARHPPTVIPGLP